MSTKYQWRPAKAPAKNSTVASTPIKGSTVSKRTNFINPPKVKKEDESELFDNKNIPNYFGPRGYTVSKSDLTPEQINAIRKMQTAKPVNSNAAFGAASTVEFPIYRESPNKMYLPRYKGEQLFGPIQRYAIPEPDTIELPFIGSLRENQVPVVDAFFAFILRNLGGGGLLELPCAYGKTIIALYIIAKLGLKTLVVVGKEFLLNQWIEKIHMFLPDAKIGKIQGPIIDVDNCDIVIGMLQSLSQKEYDASVFQSFGLTIFDEVHHISSEKFSQILFKFVTKYTLGLSATMDRKDGTTFVFKQFLGDVVFKGENTEKHNVEVRAIEYESKDHEFNIVETDFRGNPKYSTMVVKLCNFVDRSNFIIQVIRDLILEQPNAQIMILAHNRSILTYLHDSIAEQNIASVGYYVGGMREAALKESEEKQIVVATYAMAAEALDIKSLSTLIMVTPKTDIVQSVGRILRERHKTPLVIDIVDKHAVFQNQWVKRRRYYKKCEYTIHLIHSDMYCGFAKEAMENWKLVYRAAKNLCGNNITDSSSDDDEEEDRKTPNKCFVMNYGEDEEN
jgi:superfamily II DNA or RNA helicase